MKITKGQNYQFLELERGLIITYANAPVRPPAALLIEADVFDLAAYLVRYLTAREEGLNLGDAHKAARKLQ